MLPDPQNSQLFLDFDGTITQSDTLDALILQFAVNTSWHEIERQWQAGEIGSRACLSQEFALIRISDSQLEHFLDAIEIDPGLGDLLSLLTHHQVPRAILSDGIDAFIHRVLKRAGFAETVRANTISRDGNAMTLQCPLAKEGCESAAAHCKCASLRDLALPARKSIYVGDGRSDLCPSRKVDVIFAKGKLAETLAAEGRAFIPFQTLHDVATILSERWSGK